MWLVKKQFDSFNKVSEGDVMDIFFSDVFKDSLGFNHNQYPPVELSETDTYKTLTVNMPGYDKKDIQIEYKDDYISIKSDKHDAQKENEESVYYTELSHAQVARQVYVGEVDFDNAKATLNHGVLVVKLPKIKASKPARLKIS